jgi:hypothetical protein
MAKTPKMFRFTNDVYTKFKELAGQSGYTATAAFEKFMNCCVQNGALAFPAAAKAEDVEAEGRIMLDWLRKGKYWFYLKSEEQASVTARLLQLLPQVRDVQLKTEIEEQLKKSVKKGRD